jgi:putative transposase
MTYPLVLDLAATGVPVAVTCRVLGFSRQAFYAWQHQPVSDRDLDDAYLTDAALAVHHDDPEFGYRFVADELRAAGLQAGERRVWRLCSQAQIFSAHSRKRGKNGKAGRPGPPVHDDRVERVFAADAPNVLWLTDITEHWTAEGKLYLCAIKDVYSNRIVGYSISDRMQAALAVDALNSAAARRGHDTVAGCVVHSDRGSQGGFNWSSQHLTMRGGVRDGATSAGSRSGDSPADEVARPSEVPPEGRGRLLGSDR